MADLLGSVENIVNMGPEMVIQGLAGLIDGVGTGTEWTGEQVDKLGELEQHLADQVRQLKGNQGKSNGK
ncbi:MAG: hypothetical protein QOJ23_3492 [Actinomycetota bacterium]|jgi:hypothetical protein|nr:hypothetical protein [Actinomycetota bacterium]MDQ1565603.1 hypothetical protein [Actinomycetota bacterium]